MDDVAPRGRALAANPNRSATGVVRVEVAGWHPGDPPVASGPLTLLVEEAGADLGDALDMVDRLLAGDDTVLPLANESEAAAAAELHKLGLRTKLLGPAN